MAVTDYTTFADIRAALGVNVDELSDATLGLDLYTYGLDIEMRAIDAGLPAAYVVVAAVSPASSRTAAQAALFSAVKAFAPYAVAVQLASSLPLFAPKTVTDGKASVSRDSSAPYAATIAECKANYGRFRSLVESAYSTIVGGGTSVVLRPFFAAVSPSTDPVTGA